MKDITSFFDNKILDKLEDCLSRAVSNCINNQKENGSWEYLRDPRVFETALAGYALSSTPGNIDANRVEKARKWLASAKPQSHSSLAYLIESTVQNLLLKKLSILTLNELIDPVFANRLILLQVLAIHAGLKVDSFIDEEALRKKLAQKCEESEVDQLKKWSTVEILSLQILLEYRINNHEVIQSTVQKLITLQASDGSFSFNPISTSIAYLALSVAAPHSEVWKRCRNYLLKTQHSDGTWRFCSCDVWDTILIVRSFKAHPVFVKYALQPSLNFIKSMQNIDGGWSYTGNVESDNDTTGTALLALSGLSQGDEVIPQAVNYLRSQQTEDGLWPTWQFKLDPPVEDVVAHVVSGLDSYASKHKISVQPAKKWLTEQYKKHQAWKANWYKGTPYAVTEVCQALGQNNPMVHIAIDALKNAQNSDGGWGTERGLPSSPSATGLAILAISKYSSLNADSSIYKGLEFLIETQQDDGTWKGEPEMYGPRPLLTHCQSDTQSFAICGAIEVWRNMSSFATRK
jgi:squalene-hopene/tetraprenyl-beta-curcumene cyclase